MRPLFSRSVTPCPLLPSEPVPRGATACRVVPRRATACRGVPWRAVACLHGRYVFIVFGLGSNTMYFIVFGAGAPTHHLTARMRFFSEACCSVPVQSLGVHCDQKLAQLLLARAPQWDHQLSFSRPSVRRRSLPNHCPNPTIRSEPSMLAHQVLVLPLHDAHDRGWGWQQVASCLVLYCTYCTLLL